MDVWEYMRSFTDVFNSLCITRWDPDAVYMNPYFVRIIAATVWFSEQLRRSASDGRPFPQLNLRRGVLGQELAILASFSHLWNHGGVYDDEEVAFRSLEHVSNEKCFTQDENDTVWLQKALAARIKICIDEGPDVARALRERDQTLLNWIDKPAEYDMPAVLQGMLKSEVVKLDASRRTSLRQNADIHRLIALLPEDHILNKVLSDEGFRPRPKGGPMNADPPVSRERNATEAPTPRLGSYTVGAGSS